MQHRNIPVDWNRSGSNRKFGGMVIFTRSESFSECRWRRALKGRDGKSFRNSREDYLFNLAWPDTLGGSAHLPSQLEVRRRRTFCSGCLSQVRGTDRAKLFGDVCTEGGEKNSKTWVKQRDQLGGWSTFTS